MRELQDKGAVFPDRPLFFYLTVASSRYNANRHKAQVAPTKPTPASTRGVFFLITSG